MIYIRATSNKAVDNFALEYWLTQKHFHDMVFLLWSTEPTIMLGKYQDALAEVNLEYANKHHLQVVRRMSGGGTIFTDPGSFQYSFIVHSAKQTIDFSRFLNIICNALRRMGIPVERSSRNDLTIKGRKFSGNAQYNHNGYIVHHGSLLFNSDIGLMSRALHVDKLKLKSKKISSVHQRVINLHQFLPKLNCVSFHHSLVRQVLKRSKTVHNYQLTSEDKKEIRQIKGQVFANDDFIYGTIPQTSISKERYFPGGGLVRVAITVSHGKLIKIHITGDFFSNLNIRKLEDALMGCEFKPSSLEIPLSHWLAQYPIMNISVEDLLNLLFK